MYFIVSLALNGLLVLLSGWFFMLYRHQKNAVSERQHFNDEIQKTFSLLSAQALKDNNQSFLSMIHHTLEQHTHQTKETLEHKEKSIEALVRPVRDTLKNLEGSLQTIEKERIHTHATLSQHIQGMMHAQKELRQETQQLAKALHAPMSRGRWGELQLKRVVEMAGMLSHCDFSEQTTLTSPEGKMFKPDMIIHMPNGQKVVVDAKTPLTSYFKATETDDILEKKQLYRAHGEDIRRHMRQLSQKSYTDQVEGAVEFVVLFLPGEPFFSAALEHMPSLIEEGVKERVIIATPTTLIALLRTVAYGWRQEEAHKNVEKIASLSQELYKRLAGFIDKFQKIGKTLHTSVQAYNDAVGSFDRRVLSTARKFEDMDSTFSSKASPTLLEESSIKMFQSPEAFHESDSVYSKN